MGRIINEEGARFKESYVTGLTEVKPPKNGAQLQQFICAVNWMRTAIPDFNMLVAPMQQLLGKIQKEMGSAKSKVLGSSKGQSLRNFGPKR